ncbi:hypothetical protein PM082_016690 [Marasmius tenuissimus]|nr:hypothetical protein PM082_016690 [Marasmius tenuissimus]
MVQYPICNNIAVEGSNQLGNVSYLADMNLVCIKLSKLSLTCGTHPKVRDMCGKHVGNSPLGIITVFFIICSWDGHTDTPGGTRKKIPRYMPFAQPKNAKNILNTCYSEKCSEKLVYLDLRSGAFEPRDPPSVTEASKTDISTCWVSIQTPQTCGIAKNTVKLKQTSEALQSSPLACAVDLSLLALLPKERNSLDCDSSKLSNCDAVSPREGRPLRTAPDLRDFREEPSGRDREFYLRVANSGIVTMSGRFTDRNGDCRERPKRTGERENTSEKAKTGVARSNPSSIVVSD